jgi:hypothetical protein
MGDVRVAVVLVLVPVLCACGGASRGGCSPAPVHSGPPPKWTADVWSSSSPWAAPSYALADGGAAAAFMFVGGLRPGHPTDPANKVLWVVRAPRDGKPLRIVARRGDAAVRMSQPADSGPGEIYPSYVDLPTAGCWRLTLAWGPHRARIDLAVKAPAEPPGPLRGAPLSARTGVRLLVASDPPFVLDVDSGHVTRITGLPPRRGFRVVTVAANARGANLWLDPGGSYRLRRGTLRATRGAGPPTPKGRYAVRLGWPVSIVDRRTGATRRVPWPGAIGGPDEVAAAPDGRTFALSFGDPAYHATGTQITDVWLLDAPTGRFTHVPGFPAAVHLKFESFAWLPDGRLAILAQDRVALYRPGATRIEVKRLRLPARNSGSDAFIAW